MNNTNSPAPERDTLVLSRQNLSIGIYLAIFGLVAIVIFSIFAGKLFVGVAAVCISVALGALTLGLFVGFLFGIPRTSVPKEAAAAAASAGATQAAAGAPTAATASPQQGFSDHQVNTNLEDISDWLTKIIVGVSLVEFGTLTQKLGEFAAMVQKDFKVDGLGTFILAIVVLYLMTGLLFGFLWTRLELQGLIGLSDRSLLGKLRARLIQENSDAKLLQLVAAVIDPAQKLPASEEIAAGIKAASKDIRPLVFYRAREFRRNSTASGSLTALHRVIPVFEGLIAGDKADFGGDGRYHRNYGELAYVHKDRPEHEYGKAVELLTTAIELRDRFKAHEFALLSDLRVQSRLCAHQAGPRLHREPQGRSGSGRHGCRRPRQGDGRRQPCPRGRGRSGDQRLARPQRTQDRGGQDRAGLSPAAPMVAAYSSVTS